MALPDQILYIGILISIGFIWVERQWGLLTRRFGASEKTLVKIIVSLLILFVFLTIPLQVLGNIDRSRSLYMFGWIECAPASTSIDQMHKQIDDVYGKESLNAFLQRVNEQEQRNLLDLNNQKYVTSFQGHKIFQSAKLLARIFHLDGWYAHDIWNNAKCLGK